MATTQWHTVLGFEIHIELSTASKMFCGCSADHFGKTANTQVCPVCLGLPGALPVPNLKAIEDCIKLGLALNCQVNLNSKFDRKNYFYPDLPKGYQISQYDQPFASNGWLEIANPKSQIPKRIRIRRVHMEEDTGKLLHQGVETLIDFNRSGVPLVEVVTEADFADSGESDEFLKELQAIVRALGISTADMEKGSMRLEANISLSDKTQDTRSKLPDYKIEVKNVNSFRFIKKSIEFEIKRQAELLDKGETPKQETRGWQEAKGETVSQRSKEEAHDYRYFPEPDIPPLEFTKSRIEKWRLELPELPAVKLKKLVDLGIPTPSAVTIVMTPSRFARFQELSQDHDPLAVAKLLVNTPEGQVTTVQFVEKQVMTDESKIMAVAQKVVLASPKAVADIKAGKTQVLFFLIGQIKKELGDVDLKITQNILDELVNK